MIKEYPYLKDTNFLNKIYKQYNKTIYANITCLDWQENPVQQIEGRIISGSISCNGDSAVRRTANLSVKILNNNELYTNVDSMFSINKKIFLELGIKNNYAHLHRNNYYSDYPTIFFPFGVYVIQNVSVTHDLSGVTISLSLNDKMSLLNGSAGGSIPAAVNFESIDVLGPDGDLTTEWVRINQLIQEMVNHFGQEDLNKIIVNDVPNKIKQVLKWRGGNPLYLWIDKTNPKNAFYTTIEARNSPDIDINDWSVKKIIFNYDAGYSYVDFVYPGELVSGIGDSVVTILDKIKGTLGNYEFYYDVFGNFIFQEIKNYVNTSEWRNINVYGEQGIIETKDGLADSDAYLPYDYSTRLNTAIYSFDNAELITSYSNSPQFDMIKNDFIVWGERTGANDQKYPCRYHLAIDKRPYLLENLPINKTICFDTNLDDKIRRAFVIMGEYTDINSLKADKPTGISGQYYKVGNSVYTWITDIDKYKNMLNDYLTTANGLASSTDIEAIPVTSDNIGYVKMPLATLYPKNTFVVSKDTNWRNILYFQGLMENANGLNENYYWAEMCNEWPKLYDVEHDHWIDGVLDAPSSLDWWLDLIDNNVELNKFSVSAIGRRSYAKNDSGCNCVFEPDIPDIVMVNVSDSSSVADSRSGLTRAQLRELGLIPVQVSQPIYDTLIPGGTFNSCYQHIRQILADYTNYNESINVTCVPIYHLEPNTRVFFNDPDSGIYGDYIINTISFDLSGGTMNISAKKCIEKI